MRRKKDRLPQQDQPEHFLGIYIGIAVVTTHVISIFAGLEVPTVLNDALMLVLGYFYGKAPHANQ